MKPTALDCPSFVWASTYLSVTALMLLLLQAQAPVSSVLVGVFVGALALEFSVFRGGECSWLPEAPPTKALFHLLALVLGFIVILPAFGAIQHGGLFPLIPVYRVEWFFPAMLLLIGGRYLTFTTIYGMRQYWACGAALALVGFLMVLSRAPFPVGAFAGALIEYVFAAVVFAAVQNTRHAPADHAA